MKPSAAARKGGELAKRLLADADWHERPVLGRMNHQLESKHTAQLLREAAHALAAGGVAERVREACARVCEKFDHASNPRRSGVKHEIAEAIRALELSQFTAESKAEPMTCGELADRIKRGEKWKISDSFFAATRFTAESKAVNIVQVQNADGTWPSHSQPATTTTVSANPDGTIKHAIPHSVTKDLVQHSTAPTEPGRVSVGPLMDELYWYHKKIQGADAKGKLWSDHFKDEWNELNAALAASPAPASPWVSVKERLPDAGQKVVLLYPDGTQEVCEFDGHQFFGDFGGWCLTPKNKHRWLALPPAPGEERS